MTELPNPYSHASEELPEGAPNRATRLVSVITYEAYQRVRCLGLPKGYLQFTINQFWSKLIHELNARNIDTYLDTDAYVELVRNMQIKLPGECECRTTQPASGDGGATSGIVSEGPLPPKRRRNTRKGGGN